MSDEERSQNQTPYVELEPGDPAPWFKQRTPTLPEFYFSTAGGHYVVLCFFVSPQTPAAEAALKVIQSRRDHFDDKGLQFYGVVLDPKDKAGRTLNTSVPGIRFFDDFDGHVSQLYGALPRIDLKNTPEVLFRHLWIVLDRRLRVVANIPFLPDGSDADKLLPVLDRLPPLAHTPEPELIPPILIVPQVFTPELCQNLISLYEADGGYDSGFMNREQEKTQGIINHSHKRRRDYEIQDDGLVKTIKDLMRRRLVPEIKTAFQFDVTRVERQIVACYSAEDGGHFNAHRDNIIPGTAHRRFAVTFNLNENYEGGDLMFPEFGTRSFRAPVGGAIVFSCSLLHAAKLVTEGKRYAYLPFLYDEAGAKIFNAYVASMTSEKLSSS